MEVDTQEVGCVGVVEVCLLVLCCTSGIVCGHQSKRMDGGYVLARPSFRCTLLALSPAADMIEQEWLGIMDVGRLCSSTHLVRRTASHSTAHLL